MESISTTPAPTSSLSSKLNHKAQGREQISPLSLDLIPYSSIPETTPPTNKNCSFPLQELLLLSPSPSPSPSSKPRRTTHVDMAEDAAHRRCKSKAAIAAAAAAAQLGCASPSPRNKRRLRRRSKMEISEDRDFVLVDDFGPPKRKHKTKKHSDHKLPLVTSSLPTPSLSVADDDVGNLDAIGAVVYDLIMWKDVAKTSLWFGFGFLFFFSSCFAQGINISVFSAISQLGLLFLGASFISNSISQRNQRTSELKLKEEDILRVGRLILPAANLAILKTREIFSGEPSMTLKVIPFLILGAEYGHLCTLWSLCALGFFISFTIPKLYSFYSTQITQKVEYSKCWLSEAWGACSHKKIVAASAITAFWNLSSLKTRLFTAFISLVILRCCRQHLFPKQDRTETEETEQDLQKALVVVAEPVVSQKETH